MSLTQRKELLNDSPSSQAEELTQHYGRELFRLAREESRQLSPLNLWTTEIFKWSLSDPRIKSNLFRFVDVFPTLRTPREVVSHIRQYFNDPSLRLPAGLKLGVDLCARTPFSARMVSELTRLMVSHVARQFISAATPEETFQNLEKLEEQGMGFTLDLLGEATLSDGEALAYQRRTLDTLHFLAERCASPRVNLSIKLSSLSTRFDPLPKQETIDGVLERLLPLWEESIRRGAFLNIDMESSEHRDLTLEILQALLDRSSVQGYPHVGVVFQAYLKDSEEKMVEFLRWLEKRNQPLTIRLVKGAYWDCEVARARAEGWPVPVFLEKWQSDAAFERLTDILLAAPEGIRVAVASHNIRSLAHAMAQADLLKVPKTRLEFQLLYGMADAVKRTLVQMNWPVRVYVPCGELIPGMAYLVRRLLENTANESFLKHDFLHDRSEEELLSSPNGFRSADLQPLPRPPALRVPGLGRPLPNTEFTNEPLLDFSRPTHVDTMQHALDTVRQKLGRDHPLILGGREVRTRETLRRNNPAHTSQLIGRVAKATIEEVHAAVHLARGGWEAWAKRPLPERAKLLRSAAGILRDRRAEIAAWEVFEVGKNWREADADVAEAIDFLNYYAVQGLRLGSRGGLPGVPGERNQIVYRPRGVGAIIAPWNFPVAILTGMTAAALVTGNAVIVKPSKESSFVALEVIKILHDAGVPQDVLSCLPGDGSTIGAALVGHPDVAFVAFTGSREVGLNIIQKASETQPGQTRLRRVVAEMGGKNAIIVDDDADPDEAIKGILTSAFGYGGQKCSACSRVIIMESIYPSLVDRLVEAAKNIVVCPPEEPRCMMGPLIDQDAIQKVRRFIAWGAREAKLLYQGDVGPLASEGYFVGPVLFGEVQPTGRLAQEEIFGPVLSLMKARRFEEALEIANGCQYALTGGLYSRHPGHIEQARRDFDVGNLYINRKITGARVGQQPFGGHKLSGFGTKAGGHDYLLEFVVPRTITENTLRHGLPFED